MALNPHPAFVGKIIITNSINDMLYWHEFDGVTNYNLSVQLTAAEYYPGAFITLVEAAMDSESAGSGATNTYTWTFDITTGKFTATGDDNSIDFYLKAKISDTENVLTGRGNDSSGVAFTTGQWGIDGIGWVFELSYPAGATTVTAGQQMQNFWAPQDSHQASDDGKDIESTGAQASAIDGTMVTYDFSGWEDSAAEFPLYGGVTRRHALRFEFVTTTKKDEWIHHFWGPYGKAGKIFRFYTDATDSAVYSEYVLFGDSISRHGMVDRLMGFTWWTANIGMQRQ